MTRDLPPGRPGRAPDGGGRPKVFGIGLMRTGTLSLAAALEALGYRVLHYPSPPVPGHVVRLAERFDALTDIPVIPVYKRLAALHPGARFVHTVRGKEDWLRSCRAYCARHWKERPRKAGVLACRRRVFDTDRFDEGAFEAAYERHRRDVDAFFADRPDRLLTLDVTEGRGYDLLCPFLGVGEIGSPFPHLHRGCP